MRLLKKIFATLLALIFIPFGAIAFAFSTGGIGGSLVKPDTAWKVVSGVLQPTDTSWTIGLPATTMTDLNLSGTLTVDTINEHTGSTGVTIEGVLLDTNNIDVPGTSQFDGNITIGDGSSDTVTATFDGTSDDMVITYAGATNTVELGDTDLQLSAIDGVPIGATTPSTGAFTTLATSGVNTFSALNTANGLVQTDGSGVLSTTLTPAGLTSVTVADGGTMGATTNKWTFDDSNNDITTAKTTSVGIGSSAPDYNFSIGDGSTVSNPKIGLIAVNNGYSSLRLLENSDLYGFSLNGSGVDNTFYLKRHENDATGVNVFAIKRTTGYVGIGIDDPNTTLELNGTLSYTPSTDTAVVAGTALTVTNSLQRIYGTGGVTVTATPSIVDGADGQIVYIQGTDDTNTVTFQDEGNLATSGLALSGGVDFTMGVGDVLVLTYDSGDDKWYEISRSDN